jgi:hypothetical protein
MLLKIHNNRPEFFYPLDLVRKGSRSAFELLQHSTLLVRRSSTTLIPIFVALIPASPTSGERKNGNGSLIIT